MKEDRECVPTVGRSPPECPAKGLLQGAGEESLLEQESCWLNLLLKRNNAVFVLAEENLSRSITPGGCWKGHGSLPNRSTRVWWICLATIFLKVLCGAPPFGYGAEGPLSDISLSVLSEAELDSIDSVWTPPGLPFVTRYVHHFSGTDFPGAAYKQKVSSKLTSGFHRGFFANNSILYWLC